MTARASPDAPEFHTKPSTPVSPLPLHPPEAVHLTVLQNQIDPVFNLTSTHIDAFKGHIEAKQPHTAMAGVEDAAAETDSVMEETHSSESDTYGDDQDGEQVNVASPRQVAADVNDDYAMTFDSDVSDGLDSPDVSKSIVAPDIEPSNASLPVTSNDPTTFPSGPAPIVQEPKDHEATPSFQPQAAPPTTSTQDLVDVSSRTTGQTANEDITPQPQAQDNVAQDDIDIQQLLDDITKAATAAEDSKAQIATSPLPSIFSSSNPPPGSTSLPVHASLPPRPQVQPSQPMHAAYTPQDDIRNYHAGPPSIAAQKAGSYKSSGTSVSLAAAGAPGTATDPRIGLPPPPVASFQPSPAAAGPPLLSPSVQTHVQDRPQRSVERGGDTDDADQPWGPAVQKLYDDFLADERMYVTEGLWDRFPAGSRLFIGQCLRI